MGQLCLKSVCVCVCVMGKDRQAVEFGICSSIFLLVGQQCCPVLACHVCVCVEREEAR